MEQDSDKNIPSGSQKKKRLLSSDNEKNEGEFEKYNKNEGEFEEYILNEPMELTEDNCAFYGPKVPITQISIKHLRLFLQYYGLSIKDLKGFSKKDLQQKLASIVQKSTVSQFIKPKLPNDWTWQETTNFDPPKYAKRTAGPQNISNELELKLSLGTLEEIDILQLYLTGKI